MLLIFNSNAVRQAFRPAATRSFANAVAAKEMDWTAIAETVETPEGKSELMGLRASYMDIMDKATPKDFAPIDWAALKMETGNSELVSQFETTLKGMTPAKFDGDVVERAKISFTALIKEAEAHVVESNARVTVLQAELAKVRAEKEMLNTVTIEEILSGDAELKQSVQDEVREGKWFKA